MYLTWLDNNSWLIEMGGHRILLDPWLVGPLVFGNMPWFFKGIRPGSRPIPDAIDLILLSQGLEDHAHPETLKQLDRTLPVVASPNATKVVQELGYTQITTLAHGESTVLADRIKIEALPGASFGPFLVENSYILTDLQQNHRLYYEPHGCHPNVLKEMEPVDVMITPLIDLKLPFAGSILKGGAEALKAVQWLRPQFILPTAAGGEVTFEGALAAIIRSEGTLDGFRSLLEQNRLSAQVIAPKPGERVEVERSSIGR